MAFVKHWLLILTGVALTAAADKEVLVEIAKHAVDILTLSRGLLPNENYRQDFLKQMAIYGDGLAAVLQTLPDDHVAAWLWQHNMFANTVSDVINPPGSHSSGVDYILGDNEHRISVVTDALATIERPLLSFLQSNGVRLQPGLQAAENLAGLKNTIDSVGALIDGRLRVDRGSVKFCKPFNLYLGHVGSKSGKIDSLQMANVYIVWTGVTSDVKSAYTNALRQWVSPTYGHLKTYNKLLVDIVRACVYGYVRVHAALFFSYHSTVKDIGKRQENVDECYDLWTSIWITLNNIVDTLDLGWDEQMTALLKVFDKYADFEASKSDKLLKSLDKSLLEISSSSNYHIISDVTKFNQLTKKTINFKAMRDSVRSNKSNFGMYTSHIVYDTFKGVSFKHVNKFLNSFS